MLRPGYLLDTLPLEELIDDCHYLLEVDEKELNKQLAIFNKFISRGHKSEADIERWESRLEHLQTRLEFFSALLFRFQTFDTLCLISALNQSKKEAKRRGNLNNYGFSIFFKKDAVPNILIY